MTQVPPIFIDVTVDQMRQTLRHHVTNMLDPAKVTAAIDRAFAGFDFYAEIEKMARAALNDVVVTQASDIAWPVREAIRKAAEERVRELVAPLVASVVPDTTQSPMGKRRWVSERRLQELHRFEMFFEAIEGRRIVVGDEGSAWSVHIQGLAGAPVICETLSEACNIALSTKETKNEPKSD